jgi:hypothetical protein
MPASTRRRRLLARQLPSWLASEGHVDLHEWHTLDAGMLGGACLLGLLDVRIDIHHVHLVDGH